MATYSNNVTIKYVGGFSINASGGSSSSYTVPAGHFVIMGFARSTGNSAGEFSPVGVGRVSVGGLILVESYSGNGYAEGKAFGDIHIPEGKVITVFGDGKSGSGSASGVVFKNTP